MDATVVASYRSRATARELSTASIKSHVNSSHRSAYGGYSSNSKGGNGRHFLLFEERSDEN